MCLSVNTASQDLLFEGGGVRLKPVMSSVIIFFTKRRTDVLETISLNNNEILSRVSKSKEKIARMGFVLDRERIYPSISNNTRKTLANYEAIKSSHLIKFKDTVSICEEYDGLYITSIECLDTGEEYPLNIYLNNESDKIDVLMYIIQNGLVKYANKVNELVEGLVLKLSERFNITSNLSSNIIDGEIVIKGSDSKLTISPRVQDGNLWFDIFNVATSRYFLGVQERVTSYVFDGETLNQLKRFVEEYGPQEMEESVAYQELERQYAMMSAEVYQ